MNRLFSWASAMTRSNAHTIGYQHLATRVISDDARTLLMGLCHNALQFLHCFGLIQALRVALVGVGPIDQMILVQQLLVKQILQMLDTVKLLCILCAVKSTICQPLAGVWCNFWRGSGQEGHCEKAHLKNLLWCFTCLVYVHSSCADCSSTCVCNDEPLKLACWTPVQGLP